MDSVSAHICRRFADNIQAQEYYKALWREYEATGLADSTFVGAISSGEHPAFWQRVWEMLLARHLTACGHQLSSDEKGPDFRFEVDDKVIWCEAVCPEPKGIPAECLRVGSDRETRVVQVPSEAMLLRWTAVIKEKRDKLEGRYEVNRRTRETEFKKGYRQNKIVADEDCYVIAVNGCQLSFMPMWEAGSTLPIILQAVLPLGPLGVPLRNYRPQVDEAFHTYRPNVNNHNGSPVPTDTFLDKAYAGVSAVMGAVKSDDWNGSLDIVVVHNHLAHAPLPVGILGAAREYVPRALGNGEYQFDVIDNRSRESETES